MRQIGIACWVLLQIVYGVHGQEFNERFSDWPLDLSIPGRIIVANELQDFSVLSDLLDPEDEDGTLCILCEADMQETLRSKYEPYVAEIQFFDPNQSDDLQNKTRSDADLIAWHGGSGTPPDFPEEQLGKWFRQVVSKGKTLIAMGPGAKRFSHTYFSVDGKKITAHHGWNLLPDCILEFTSPTTKLGLPEMRKTLSKHPKRVGVLLDNSAALALVGRKIVVAGDGRATLALSPSDRPHPGPASESPAARMQQTIRARTGRRQPTSQWLLDLTQWRRMAMDQTLPDFPPAHPDVPKVHNGTLFIVGGGGLPKGLMDSFIEAAGGTGQARLVYVPCSEARKIRETPAIVRAWQRQGIQHATYIHTKDRVRANEDDQFLEPLRDATGIWFGGGRQWNFADSYYGTTAHQLMKDVLHRGGAIGGSSAGASIQARYLARATPIENFDIMAPGYERGGLGFLSGVAIDQHFSQRNRQPNMSQLVDRYPQLLGIGIDETTALIVRQSIAEIVGQGRVFFYDRQRPIIPDDPDYQAFGAGISYNLAERQAVFYDKSAIPADR